MILALTVRRLDCSLEPTKAEVVEAATRFENESYLNHVAGQAFHTASPATFGCYCHLCDAQRAMIETVHPSAQARRS